MKNKEKNYSEIKKNNPNMKGGFSLLEIALAVMLMGLIIILVFPTIIFNSNKGNINSVVTNDAKMIAQAVTEWRSSSSDSDGTYTNMTTDKIVPYLPTKMEWDSTNQAVKSTGLNGGVKYQVLSDKIVSDGDSFKILINFTEVVASKNFDDRTVTYAETSANDTFKKLSTDPTSASAESGATAIGAANVAMTAGGTTTDGICGVSKLKF